MINESHMELEIVVFCCKIVAIAKADTRWHYRLKSVNNTEKLMLNWIGCMKKPVHLNGEVIRQIFKLAD